MAQLTVRQAAQQVGISRQTMFRKIKEGKVSATTDHDGQLQIDTSELLRAFGGALQSPGDSEKASSDSPRQANETAATPAGLNLALAEIAALKDQLDQAQRRRESADNVSKMLTARVRDLGQLVESKDAEIARLDKLADKLTTTIGQMALLLEDKTRPRQAHQEQPAPQPAPTPETQAPEQKRKFWQFWKS